MKKQDFDISVFAKRFSELLKDSSENTYTLAEKLGLTPATISRYANGLMAPKLPTLYAIADIFEVNPVWLFGYNAPKEIDRAVYNRQPDNIIPMPKMKSVPLVGTIACGMPVLATENIECEVEMPEHVRADFALRCKGDSMINARIFDGDVVYIRKQERVENGEIAAVLIGDEATLKRVRFYGDHIALEPENPMFKPLVFWGEEMENVQIIGKAVAFTSNIR